MTHAIEPKNAHQSVLKSEVLAALNVCATGRYLDATVGRGGHLAAILERLGPTGEVIGLDQDWDAVQFCTERFANDPRVQIIHTNFEAAPTLNLGRFDGILMDLGVSSPQIDNPERGFSYQNDGALDMRMNRDQQLDAATVLNTYDAHRLTQIFQRYGEVNHPQAVVRAIIRQRPLYTTREFVELIHRALPAHQRFAKGGHPEKVYFQALRIYVNRELDVLENTLPRMAEMLRVGGTLCVITFHSLEERITRQIFRELSVDHLPPEIPLNERWQTYEMGAIQKPGATEVAANSRAASAKLFILHRRKEHSRV